MHTSMRLLIMCLWIAVSKIENSSAQTENPDRAWCTTQPSVAFDKNLIPKLSKEWYVTRATLRTTLRQGLPEPTMNNCTPMTYFDSCKGAIYVERQWSKDAITKMTKAYSEQYKDIAEYWEDQQRNDPNYFSWKSAGKSMTLHFKDGNYKNIPLSEVPVVENALARTYALTAYGFVIKTGQVDWALYEDCDENFAWLEVPKSVVENEENFKDVNQRIDNFLKEPPTPMEVPQMVKLPTKLPF